MRPRWIPLLLLAGGGLLLVSVAVALLARSGTRTLTVTQTVTTAVTRTVTASAAATTTTPPAGPAPVAFSWSDAGGLVVNSDEVDPTVLGETMRGLGFGWIAVQIADGSTLKSVGSFVTRFRVASGLPVGGWSVLRGDPVAEAQLAAGIVRRDGLDFYVADAEQEYSYTDGADRSPQRYARSLQFVDAFRAAEPTLPAAISSYCRPDMHDLDWAAWAGAAFDFLPQAYVGDLGPEGDPAVCVRAAARFFPRPRVHPTIGIFPGQFATPTPPEYAALLQAAGTTGFSLYPAENANELWQAYGQELQILPLAHRAP